MTVPQGGAVLRDIALLAKPRLVLLVLFAAAIGHCRASGGEGVEWARLGWALAGTGLVAGGAGALNQVLEARTDGCMQRTRNRPLPAGRVSRAAALGLGLGLTLCGVGCLVERTTGLAAALAALACAVYVGIYTPMKRRSALCVAVGALAGALPPVIGWAARDGTLTGEAARLFAILFAWQIPHSLAIAWLHREDYARAGLVLLPGGDAAGRAVAVQVVGGASLVAVLTFLPGNAAGIRLATLVVLNAFWLAASLEFARLCTQRTAKSLFLISIVYLSIFLFMSILLRY